MVLEVLVVNTNYSLRELVGCQLVYQKQKKKNVINKYEEIGKGMAG